MRSIIIAAASAAALFAAGQAAAATTNNADLETRMVSFKGVDFNNPQSVDRFYVRLTNNAREVCAAQSSYERRVSGGERACVAQIINQAVAGMQRPMLTARAAAKSDTRFASGF